jgi:hypothetical protein
MEQEMNIMPEVGVDFPHMLENYARMYNSGSELVVGEAIGNAVDEGSTKMDITLGKDTVGPFIQFRNNGSPMKHSDFANYNHIARSSKTFGEGLGFAGIGGKLYLGIWTGSKIITTSSDGNTTNASELYFNNEKLIWDFIESDEKFYGTQYKVYLTNEDFAVLDVELGDMVVTMFNAAMINGLNVTIQGKKIHPWKPTLIKSIDCELKIENRALPFTVWITKDDIPYERCNVEYHVTGKRIVDRTPKNLLPLVKKEFKRRFHVSVDSKDISDQLKTMKDAFRPGVFTTDVEPGIEKKLLEILKELNYLEDPTATKKIKDKFSKSLQEILKEFPKLKMKAFDGNLGGGGKSAGKGAKATATSKKSIKKNQKSNKQKNPHKPKNRSGLSIITVFEPKDSRQGWTDIETQAIVINLGHKVAEKIVKTTVGRHYHLLRIITNQLLLHASAYDMMTVEDALELGDKLFDKMAEAQSEKSSKKAWNFKDKKDAERNDDGTFKQK